jgi:diguanylate cyclase (GGDEF)-like protein
LPVPRDLALQLYFGFHLVALFPLSILFLERRRMAEELHRSNERLRMQVSLDGLTGIGNRRSFDEKFAEAWTCAVSNGLPLALALIDLDNFKQFNDLYGHPAGDRCLCEVAVALRAAAHRSEGFAARFGGEEFVMLLPNSTLATASTVAERIRTAVLDLGIMHLGNPGNRASVSVGYVSVTPTPTDTQLGLIQLADAALYRAKRKGRNCIETITSIDCLRAANDHYGDTTQVRLMRLLGGGDR